MTQKQIQDQIAAIKSAGARATKSKESARQFLIEAGIIKETSKPKKKK